MFLRRYVDVMIREFVNRGSLSSLKFTRALRRPSTELITARARNFKNCATSPLCVSQQHRQRERESGKIEEGRERKEELEREREREVPVSDTLAARNCQRRKNAAERLFYGGGAACISILCGTKIAIRYQAAIMPSINNASSSNASSKPVISVN